MAGKGLWQIGDVEDGLDAGMADPEVHRQGPLELGAEYDPQRPEGTVRSLLLYVRNVVSDVGENGDGRTIVVENNFPSNSENLLREFLPEEYRQSILELSQGLDEGVYFKCKWAVGDKEQGTQHGHYFYLLKEEGVVKIYFVDPEKVVGRRNRYRPAVTNLMAAEIPDSAGCPPRFAVLRYRHKNLEVRGQAHSELFAAADKLLMNHGQPGFLADSDAYQTTFRIVGGDQYQIVESRHGSAAHLEDFLHRGAGCLHLEGKAFAQRAILRTFIRQLAKGKFERWKAKG